MRQINIKIIIMKIIDTLHDLTKTIIEENQDTQLMCKLKDKLMEGLMKFYRFHVKYNRLEELKEAIKIMDDISILLRLSVEVKDIKYENYKKYEDIRNQLVKMMVAELNIKLGSRKAVAERSLD